MIFYYLNVQFQGQRVKNRLFIVKCIPSPDTTMIIVYEAQM